MSYTIFKFAWEMATLLTLGKAKNCFHLTQLYIDNQLLFLQCHTAIFVPACGGKTGGTGHFPSQIHILFSSIVILFPVSYLKGYLCTYTAF